MNWIRKYKLYKLGIPTDEANKYLFDKLDNTLINLIKNSEIKQHLSEKGTNISIKRDCYYKGKQFIFQIGDYLVDNMIIFEPIFYNFLLKNEIEDLAIYIVEKSYNIKIEGIGEFSNLDDAFDE